MRRLGLAVGLAVLIGGTPGTARAESSAVRALLETLAAPSGSVPAPGLVRAKYIAGRGGGSTGVANWDSVLALVLHPDVPGARLVHLDRTGSACRIRWVHALGGVLSVWLGAAQAELASQAEKDRLLWHSCEHPVLSRLLAAIDVALPTVTAPDSVLALNVAGDMGSGTVRAIHVRPDSGDGKLTSIGPDASPQVHVAHTTGLGLDWGALTEALEAAPPSALVPSIFVVLGRRGLVTVDSGAAPEISVWLRGPAGAALSARHGSPHQVVKFSDYESSWVARWPPELRAYVGTPESFARSLGDIPPISQAEPSPRQDPLQWLLR